MQTDVPGLLGVACSYKPSAALDLVAGSPHLVVVLKPDLALGALVGRAVLDGLKVPAVNPLRPFWESDVIPEPRLPVVARWADHHPLTLVGHQVELPELSALAFDVPWLTLVHGLRRKRRRLQSAHAHGDCTVRPLPDFRSEDVADVQALQVLLGRGRAVVNQAAIRKP